MAKQDRFIFRKLDTIGAADAEQDKEFLKECFVEHGYLEVLRNCNDPRRIVLGRTGSGKTALLQKVLETEQ
jgi:type II secretory ATPase GspE/PulE/Tfp pilus assembly ATPase PilB-like protein